MKYLIVDDEPLSHEVILRYAEEFPYMQLAGRFYNGIDAINWLEENHADLVFLDIKMPKLSGLSMLKRLKSKPQIVIASAYEEYALESFDLDVADYLLKPFSIERFYSSVQRVRKRISKDEKSTSFFVKGDKEHHQLRFEEISHIEGFGQYCKIHRAEGFVLTLERLSNIESELPVDDFIRVHKSYIVSIPHIEKLVGNAIVLRGHKIPIGQSYRKSVREALRIK